jgi:hypothetical protein
MYTTPHVITIDMRLLSCKNAQNIMETNVTKTFNVPCRMIQSIIISPYIKTELANVIP